MALSLTVCNLETVRQNFVLCGLASLKANRTQAFGRSFWEHGILYSNVQHVSIAVMSHYRGPCTIVQVLLRVSKLAS